MKYSICIITYNGINRVKWLLKSIEQNTLINKNLYEIILVDDGSITPVRKEVKQLCEKHNVRFFQNESNLGIVKSWNKAVSEAKTDNIALLNDDIIVTEGWLKRSMYFLENNENVGAVGFPTFFMLEKSMPEYFKNNFLAPIDPTTKRRITTEQLQEKQAEENNTIGACAIVVGCAFCFKKSVWEIVGKFDENIRSLYEDYEFGTALLQRGYQNYQLRSPIIYHVLSGTFGSNPQLMAYKLMRESEEYYKRKYGGAVYEVADKLFNENKKEVKIKFLDKDYNERFENCAV